MSWNYRVLRKYDRSGGKTFTFYEIHEVYYDDSGKVASISESPVGPYGENINELLVEWSMFSDAFTKPILDFDLINKRGYESDIHEYLKPENLSFKNMSEFLEDKKIDIKALEDMLNKERLLAEDIYEEACVDKPKWDVLSFIETLRKRWKRI